MLACDDEAEFVGVDVDVDVEAECRVQRRRGDVVIESEPLAVVTE